LVRAAAEAYRKTASPAQLVVEGAEAELIGNWDNLRLQRVLTNLLSNAIKYSPDSGTIRIALALEDKYPPSDIHLASGRPPDALGSERWARLTVQDEGIGVPAADLPHIFERFHRGANVVGRILGIGLGLSGAKRIIEQHGGTIAVASRQGSGTTVTVCLPLALSEVAPKP
jgi:signal transduction histidine kinase